MNRRHWIQLASASSPAFLHPFAHGKESTGSWSDESRAEYSLKLINWLLANFESRAEQLSLENGTPFNLEYEYLAPTDDRKILRNREKFEEGRLSAKATEEHVSSILTELERVRVSLAKAEAIAAESWKPDSDSIVVKDGRIYDTHISAGRLSVILDSSRSMTPYLEKLRDEISRDFSEAYFVEADGCHLDRNGDVPWFFSAPISGVNPFTPDRHIPRVPTWNERPYSQFIGWNRAVPSAIDAMVDLMHSDTIYWFCDFDDDDDDQVVKQLARKIMDRKVKLFVHTMDRKPPNLISLLAERSGGQVIKKRI